MSKLRENIENVLIGFTGNSVGSLQLEQITDDFSVKFFDWANSYGWELDNQFQKTHTTQELQQYFKDNIYGKE